MIPNNIKRTGFWFLASLLAPLFFSYAVSATSIKAGSTAIVDNSSTVTIHRMNVDTNNNTFGSESFVFPSMEFNRLNDFVLIRLVLEDKDGEAFRIIDISDNNTNDAFTIEYDYPEDLSANDKAVLITLRYTQYNTADSFNPVQIVVSTVDESGSMEELILDGCLNIPNSGLNTSEVNAKENNYFLTFITISGATICFVALLHISRSNMAKNKIRVAVIAGFALVLVLASSVNVIAGCRGGLVKIPVSIDFSDIKINGPYTVTFTLHSSLIERGCYMNGNTSMLVESGETINRGILPSVNCPTSISGSYANEWYVVNGDGWRCIGYGYCSDSYVVNSDVTFEGRGWIHEVEIEDEE